MASRSKRYHRYVPKPVPDWIFKYEGLPDEGLAILRYNDRSALDKIAPKLQGIRGKKFWTEGELKRVLGVRSVRTPHNQRILFDNACFIGQLGIWNEKYGGMRSQHVWWVRILRMDGVKLGPTWPCLLQISSKRYYAKGLGDPEKAFRGVCFLVADDTRRIVKVDTDLEGRI